jgi:hypothetical protein
MNMTFDRRRGMLRTKAYGVSRLVVVGALRLSLSAMSRRGEAILRVCGEHGAQSNHKVLPLDGVRRMPRTVRTCSCSIFTSTWTIVDALATAAGSCEEWLAISSPSRSLLPRISPDW